MSAVLNEERSLMPEEYRLKRAYYEITNVCNLNCSFCPGTGRKKKFVSAAEFKRAATELKKVTDYLYLHVMGEPLLHPELEEILNFAAEIGFKINVTTNGTLLPSKQGILLGCSALRKVSVSLHSFEGNHGEPKGAEDGLTGYLEGVWEFCSRANCIVALRLWNGGGAEELNDRIMAFLSEKTGLDVPRLPDTANGRRLGEKLFLESAGMFTWPSENTEEQTVSFCHGVSGQIGVLADGTVVPCCLDSEGAVALGNIYEEAIEDVLGSERAMRLRESFVAHRPSEDLCRHCSYAVRF